jgi:hypothetical protein
MARFSPYTLQLQLTRMFRDGQSFFATSKIEQWLMERGEDPFAYRIAFHQRPAPEGSDLPFLIEIDLQRKDGQPVDPWILKQLEQQA